MADERASAAALRHFVELAGARLWARRMAELGGAMTAGPHLRRAMQQRHALELALDRLHRGPDHPPAAAERQVAELAGATVALAARLTAAGRARLGTALQAGLAGEQTLLPLFHMVRTASLQQARGFAVSFAGLEDAAPFDLLIERDGIAAEVACDVVSAEEGRDLHRSAWVRLADRIDPELQTWLAAHPGRYVLKLTLPQGLRIGPDGQDGLAALHARIRTLLAAQHRADHDEAAVLRLDPLMLAAAQADELGLMSSLRREFGPEAHLAVTAAGGGVFVMAARAGRENEIAAAIRRRMAAIVPTRLTGTRPGILAMLVDDTDRTEWRHLRERLELEGAARQFLTHKDARGVVAVTCASRFELLGAAAPDGELRFRNPAHPAARAAALAPAVLSSV